MSCCEFVQGLTFRWNRKVHGPGFVLGLGVEKASLFTAYEAPPVPPLSPTRPNLD